MIIGQKEDIAAKCKRKGQIEQLTNKRRALEPPKARWVERWRK